MYVYISMSMCISVPLCIANYVYVYMSLRTDLAYSYYCHFKDLNLICEKHALLTLLDRKGNPVFN